MASVLVHIDLDGDRPHPSSLQALAAGRRVASSWGATLYAALVAHQPGDRSAPDSTAQVVTAAQVPGIETIETALARGGADKILVALTDGDTAPLWDIVGPAWQAVLDHLRPRLVLFGANAPAAAELAPRTGARIGGRLCLRARVTGTDEVELRDRDGGYVRASDSGAAVALVGRADPVGTGEDDVDLIVLAVPSPAEPAVELVTTAPAELSQTSGALVALGDEVAGDEAVVANARRLARFLGAELIGGKAPVHAGVVDPGALVDPSTPLAPELCVVIGRARLDLAGTTSWVQIGAPAGKTADGAMSGTPATGVAKLVDLLEAE